MAAQTETSAGAVKGGKFLTFFLAEEEYGIEILKVQEILGMMPITPVPRVPVFIKGVINLRGHIIPVVDIRLKLNMPETARTELSCVIVVKAQGGGTDVSRPGHPSGRDAGHSGAGIEMGIIVDRVSEVADIAGADIELPPNFGGDINTDYILGVGKSDNRVRLILDIDKVLTAQDVIDIKNVKGSGN